MGGGQRRRCITGSLLLACTLATAQGSRQHDEIQRARQQPSGRGATGVPLQREWLGDEPPQSYVRQVAVGGAVDLGMNVGERPSAPPCEPTDPPRPRPASRVAGIGPSLIQLHAQEPLRGALAVTLHLEHGFDAGTGALSDACGKRFFNRTLSLAVEGRRFGRLAAGREVQPAWAVAVLGDPWAGRGVASPAARSYRGAHDRDPLPALGERSDRALIYESPERRGLRAAGMAALRRGHGAASEAQQGASLFAMRGAWQVAAGWQRWSARDHVLPLAAQVTLGLGQLYGAATAGERDGAAFRSLFGGVVWRDRSGPRPGQTRLGALWLRREGLPDESMVSFGRLWPLGPRTSWAANLAWMHSFTGRARTLGEIGIRHEFAW
jgi:hypothetical protein